MNTTSAHLLLVAEDGADRRRVARALGRAGFTVTTAEDATQVLRNLEKIDPEVIVVDHSLRGYLNGMDLLRYAKRRRPGIPVIVTAASGDERMAVEAMHLGALSYLPQPFEMKELIDLLTRARQMGGSSGSRPQEESPASELVGQSAAIKRVRDMVADVAPTTVTVLLLGETGTGKELVARAIHEASPRAGQPFVPVNCAAIPETLLEAELFGHTKGAFTGAEQARDGKLVSADRGTLFLDEIGELPMVTQPKLLRFLEDGMVTPLGSDRPQAVDVRFIAATHRDLRQAVDEGSFREDLYYRLHVVPLRLPPLRDRPEDIPLLLHHLLRRLSARHGKTIRAVTPPLEAWLRSQPWKGNVRELENCLERLVVFCRDGVLRLPANTVGDSCIFPYHEEKRRVVEEFERRYLERALATCKGKLADVARCTGISPRQLYNLLKKHGLQKHELGESNEELGEQIEEARPSRGSRHPSPD